MSTLTTVELTGSGNWQVPPGVYWIEEVWGTAGSGGGGRGVTLALGGQAAAGGAGALKRKIPVVPGQLIPYQQGQAGAGAPPTSGNSTNGTDTFFGTGPSYYMLAKASVGGANNTNSVAAIPQAADCIGDVTVSGGTPIANSGGAGGEGGPGASVGTITGGAGGITGSANNAIGGTGGGPGGDPSGGGGGGRNLNNDQRQGGSGANGKLFLSYYRPEVWS